MVPTPGCPRPRSPLASHDRNGCMAQSRWVSRRSFTAGVGVAAMVAAVAAGQAQSGKDKWWPGYSGGPDNSHFFQSRQINKSNVGRLQVAWTYPFGETA